MPGSQGTRVGAGLGAKVLAAALGLAFGLLGCELMARAVYPAPPDPSREPQILYQSHPDLGFLHVPNQKGWLDDGLATINAMGLRGELPRQPKPSNSLRILAIGDSTTFGWGVGDDGTYPAHLARLLGPELRGRVIEIINGGVGAYDLKHDINFLRHFEPVLKPDVVLVGLYWNDLPYESGPPDGEAPRPKSGAAAATVAADSRQKPFRIGNQPSGLNRALRKSRALYILRQAWLRMIAPTASATNLVQWEMALLDGRDSPAIDAGWSEIAAGLGEIRSLSETAGFVVGVVVIPIRAQVEGSYPHAKYQARVREIAESFGFFVVDPLPRLQEQPRKDTLFIPYDRMHLSSLGNAQIAEATLELFRGRPEIAAAYTH